MTACSGGGRPNAVEGTRSAQVVAAPAGPPAAGKCPLTGLDPGAGVSVDRPVLAVKIDGSLSAEPQSGLDTADVVYVEPVAGGLAWFLAIFQCGNPDRVGPIRESSIVDPDLLSLYGSGLFATAGGPQVVRDKVKATPGLVTVDSLTQGAAYSRDSSHAVPHNLFADPAKLRAVKVQGSLKPLAAPGPQFDFTSAARPPSPSAGAKGPKAQSVKFRMGPQLTYKYDAAANAYLRSENGQPHLAGVSQLQVVNVVIMWVKINQTQIVDPAGNTSPQPVVVGQGNAMVLTGGMEHAGKWSRGDAASPLRLADPDGKPIPLTPGNTWIHIIPAEEAVFVE